MGKFMSCYAIAFMNDILLSRKKWTNYNIVPVSCLCFCIVRLINFVHSDTPVQVLK